LVGELGSLGREEPWSPEQIAVPVLAMRGEHGPAHHEEGMGVVAGWFGGGLVTVAGARHFGPNTHPDEVGAIVAEFAERAITGARAD